MLTPKCVSRSFLGKALLSERARTRDEDELNEPETGETSTRERAQGYIRKDRKDRKDQRKYSKTTAFLKTTDPAGWELPVVGSPPQRPPVVSFLSRPKPGKRNTHARQT